MEKTCLAFPHSRIHLLAASCRPGPNLCHFLLHILCSGKVVFLPILASWLQYLNSLLTRLPASGSHHRHHHHPVHISSINNCQSMMQSNYSSVWKLSVPPHCLQEIEDGRTFLWDLVPTCHSESYYILFCPQLQTQTPRKHWEMEWMNIKIRKPNKSSLVFLILYWGIMLIYVWD